MINPWTSSTVSHLLCGTYPVEHKWLPSTHLRIASHYFSFHTWRNPSIGQIMNFPYIGIPLFIIIVSKVRELMAVLLHACRIMQIQNKFLSAQTCKPHIPLFSITCTTCFHQVNHLIMLPLHPTPVLLLCNFNDHHSEWGSVHNDSRDNLIERLTLHFTVALLNDCGAPTHLSFSHAT